MTRILCNLVISYFAVFCWNIKHNLHDNHIRLWHNVGVACNTAPLWTYNTMILSQWTDGLCYSCMSRTAVNDVIPMCLSSMIQLPRDNSLSTYIFDLFPIFNWLEFHLCHLNFRSCISADDPCLRSVMVTRPHNVMLYFGLLPRNSGESGYNARTMSITLASTLSRKKYTCHRWIVGYSHQCHRAPLPCKGSFRNGNAYLGWTLYHIKQAISTYRILCWQVFHKLTVFIFR